MHMLWTDLYRDECGRWSDGDFHDVQAAGLVRDEKQSSIVFRHIVGERGRITVCGFRDEVSPLGGLCRIADVENAQPTRKPSDVSKAVLIHDFA